MAAAQEEARYVEGSDRNAEIVRNDFQMDDAGNFQADMETSNSILQSSSGISRPGPEQETGSYEMTGERQEHQLCLTTRLQCDAPSAHSKNCKSHEG